MGKKLHSREVKRLGKHSRIRKKVSGTADRPRLVIHRSLKNFYAQIVDDSTGKVLCGMSTRNKGVAGKAKNGGNVTGATALGEEFAALAKKNGVSKVCFDRGGYIYHGRIKAFADAVRENGLEF